jgi:hypothetical protein
MNKIIIILLFAMLSFTIASAATVPYDCVDDLNKKQTQTP